MALINRNGTYYIKLTGPGGEPIRRSAKTKNRKEAQEYHDTLKAEIWKVKRLGLKPARTWDEGIYRWALERQHLPGFVNYKYQIAWWTEHLRGRYLHEITRELVDELITLNLSHLTSATKDHYLKPVRGMLNQARNEWGWLDSVPRFRTYRTKGEGERTRWISVDEFKRLMLELPKHSRAAAMFSLATGQRRSNVLKLKKVDIDLTRQVAHFGTPHNRTKNGKLLTVPLNQYALMALAAVWDDHSEWVFTYRGDRLQQVNTRAWHKALKRAGIQDFRWHDLRHTWASWMAQQGVSELRLMELGGWSSLEMVKRYRHLNVHHLAPDVARLDSLLDTPLIEAEMEVR